MFWIGLIQVLGRELASQIVIIYHGRAVASGTPAELKRRVGANVLEVYVVERDDVATVAATLERLAEAEPQIDEETRRISISLPAATDSRIPRTDEPRCRARRHIAAPADP